MYEKYTTDLHKCHSCSPEKYWRFWWWYSMYHNLHNWIWKITLQIICASSCSFNHSQARLITVARSSQTWVKDFGLICLCWKHDSWYFSVTSLMSETFYITPRHPSKPWLIHSSRFWPHLRLHYSWVSSLLTCFTYLPCLNWVWPVSASKRMVLLAAAWGLQSSSTYRNTMLKMVKVIWYHRMLMQQ